MYAFGVLAWEVSLALECLNPATQWGGTLSQIFAGRAPFSEEGRIAGVYSMLNGRRPSRPDHPELSDRVWEMIKGCWESVASRRRTIADVIAVLGAELSCE